MVVLAFIGFTCAYLIVGSDVAFLPGIYEASTSWIGIAFVINIVVAIIGGFICALIAKGGRAPLALAILAVGLGLVGGVGGMNKRKKNAGVARTPNTPRMETGQKAYLPGLGPLSFSLSRPIGIFFG